MKERNTMDNSEIGNRMKAYESVSQTGLMKRTPVVVRVDGKAFHTLTKGFKKPFDDVLIDAMQDTMWYLCRNIQGCVLGYVQSDEISLLLIDYKNINTSAFFDYRVQKICSVVASMATMAFNTAYLKRVANWSRAHPEAIKSDCDPDLRELYMTYVKQINRGMFDARCFNLPKEEVTNYFYWRQLDASRNSVLSVGYANFTQGELANLNCNQVKDKLINEKGINWNELMTIYKRGCCCVRREVDGEDTWVVDMDIPKFVKDGRKYIDDLVFLEGNN